MKVRPCYNDENAPISIIQTIEWPLNYTSCIWHKTLLLRECVPPHYTARSTDTWRRQACQYCGCINGDGIVVQWKYPVPKGILSTTLLTISTTYSGFNFILPQRLVAVFNSQPVWSAAHTTHTIVAHVTTPGERLEAMQMPDKKPVWPRLKTVSTTWYRFILFLAVCYLIFKMAIIM